MTPEQYDAWYRTPRGKWIGELEYQLLRRLVAPAASENFIDVGCGTGYFTRGLALDGNPVRSSSTESDQRIYRVKSVHWIPSLVAPQPRYRGRRAQRRSGSGQQIGYTLNDHYGSKAVIRDIRLALPFWHGNELPTVFGRDTGGGPCRPFGDGP